MTIALTGCSSSSDQTTQVETAKQSAAPPPPAGEYTRFQSPYPDVDQQNTRAARSALKAANVARLEEAWVRPIEGAGKGEGFVASPIVTDNIVFLQDLDSNVAALNLSNGRAYWEKRFDVPALPPGGLSVSRGLRTVYGATPTEAFGLDERTGEEMWSLELAETGSGTRIETTPEYYNGFTYFVTRPDGAGEATSDVLWGLAASFGARKLRFEPGRQKTDLGHGLTGVPAFDRKSGIYMGTGAPGPSSVVKLDETNGKLEWSHRLGPSGGQSSVWDPVVAKLGGRKIVIAAGRSGTIAALERGAGEVLWRHSSGSEVVGPIAVSEGTVFVPTGDGRQGSLLALSLSNGTMQWKHGFQSSLSGPVLATNDLVFATSSDGWVYVLGAKTGKKLWSKKISSTIEGGLTVASDTLLIRAGAPGSNPGPELVAYRLSASR